MKVAELMAREVMACSPDDNLNRAAQIMWENDCGCVPVVDSAARVLGMLTDRDICMAAYTQGQTLNHIAVSAVMSSEVFACEPGDELLDAQKVMRKHQVRRLPVNDSEGRLVGLLSLTDIARAIARKEVTKATAADTLVRVCAPHPRPPSTKLPATTRPSDSQKGVPLGRHELFHARRTTRNSCRWEPSPEPSINRYFWHLKHYLNDNPDCHLELRFDAELAHLIYAGPTCSWYQATTNRAGSCR